jgi:hypothetical protein
MKALRIILIVVALAIFGCAGAERKSDKCVVGALETQLGNQERLDRHRKEVTLDEYAWMTNSYIRSMRWQVRNCLR